MCFDHEFFAEAYSEEIRKARKRHRCDECDETIPAGALYRYASGIFEGTPFTVHECGACAVTRFRVHEHEEAEGCHGSESWAPLGELMEWLEYAGERLGITISTGAEGQAYLLAERSKQQSKQMASSRK